MSETIVAMEIALLAKGAKRVVNVSHLVGNLDL